MKRHRKIPGTGLAFLDVMSCGLGAVILILMLVKTDTQRPDPRDPPEDTVNVEELTQTLEDLTRQAETLQAQLTQTTDSTAEAEEAKSKLAESLASLEGSLKAQGKAQEEIQAQIESLKEAIEQAPPAQAQDVLDSPVGGEENYLIGLKVEGRRIVLLVDVSASMTDDLLIDIIQRKTGSEADKKAGPKWLRTQAVVKWLLARLPRDSEVSLVAFNDTARHLGSTTWTAAGDKAGLEELVSDLAAVVPTGPTNLQRGLEEVAGLQADRLYVVTDGLPTQGTSNFKSLNPFAACNSLIGSSDTITGDCRVKLFAHSLKETGFTKGPPANVVLLPLEGDPQAAPAFWSWAANTGGLMIAPAESWP
ncbi:VWA domain-containing protein [Rhodovibrionaceae bacterium A322]